VLLPPPQLLMRSIALETISVLNSRLILSVIMLAKLLSWKYLVQENLGIAGFNKITGILLPIDLCKSNVSIITIPTCELNSATDQGQFLFKLINLFLLFRVTSELNQRF
jgi:hypothetical protein